MNPKRPIIRTQQQAAETQQTTAGQETQKQSAHAFQQAEEALRADCAQTPVPDAVKERLKASIEKEAPPAPWWKRIFGA